MPPSPPAAGPDTLAGMETWDELRIVLARLRDEQPGVLVRYPDPSAEAGHTPPFMVWLAPWAAATANDLYRQFGDGIKLTVGALPYPPARRPAWPPRIAQPADLLEESEAEADLDGPAVVRSGHTLRHGLLVFNRAGHDIQIATNGQVTAVIVDPGSGEVVGGFSGAQVLPLITFRVAPGETRRIPLLIGTASFTPRLGYAVPAGDWGMWVPLTLGAEPGNSQRRRTPVLPLTVVA
jgi:hypothetical protein